MDQTISIFAFVIESIGWIGSAAILVLGIMFIRDVTQKSVLSTTWRARHQRK